MHRMDAAFERPAHWVISLSYARYNSTMRVSRIMLNVATVLSLVLCVAAPLLIAWSFRAPVGVNLGSGARESHLSLAAGRITLDNQRAATASAAAAQSNRMKVNTIKHSIDISESMIRRTRYWDSLAEFDRERERHASLIRTLKSLTLAAPPIPPWVITLDRPVLGAVVIVLSIPLVIVVRYRRKCSARSKDNVCHVCGYDLRATPCRCPECGGVPTSGT
jgi:hypothetical protein